jgi:hypothetical protein
MLLSLKFQWISHLVFAFKHALQEVRSDLSDREYLFIMISTFIWKRLLYSSAL